MSGIQVLITSQHMYNLLGEQAISCCPNRERRHSEKRKLFRKAEVTAVEHVRIETVRDWSI